jgi:hypothetical protein
MEVRALLVGHQFAGTETRINQSLELLQCHNALPQSSGVARFVLFLASPAAGTGMPDRAGCASR